MAAATKVLKVVVSFGSYKIFHVFTAGSFLTKSLFGIAKVLSDIKFIFCCLGVVVGGC